MTDAVIFAAGAGRRLGRSIPKCLLEFGGETLLARHINALTAVDVANIFIVVSFERAMIERAVASMERADRISFIVNDAQKSGSLYSLRAASERLSGDTILMDGDVLFPARFIVDLCARKQSAILFDSGVEGAGEEMMVVLDGSGGVKEIARTPRCRGQVGESVGFALIKHSALRMLGAAIAHIAMNDYKGTADWEEALSNICSHIDVAGVDVSGRPWTEIDFPEDVTRAQALVAKIDREEY